MSIEYTVNIKGKKSKLYTNNETYTMTYKK